MIKLTTLLVASVLSLGAQITKIPGGDPAPAGGAVGGASAVTSAGKVQVGTAAGVIGDSASTIGVVKLTAGVPSAAAASDLPFTQTGTGAVARTVDAELASRFSAAQFGVVPGTNTCAALQQALTSANYVAATYGSGGGSIYFPRGVYTFTGNATPSSVCATIPSGMELYGEGGTQTPQLKYSAGAASQVFLDVPALSVNTELRNLGVTLNAVTHQAIALRVTNSHGPRLYNFNIWDWNDTSSASIGVQLRGREGFNYNNSNVKADIPISIEKNATYVYSLDFDFGMLSNLVLSSTGATSPCISIADGVDLTNATFDNLTFIGQYYGVYWPDTRNDYIGYPDQVNGENAKPSSYDIIFRNIRQEQNANANNWMFYFPRTGSNYIHGLVIDGAHNTASSTESNGVYLRKVRGGTLSNSEFIFSTKTPLNLDTSVRSFYVAPSTIMTGTPVGLVNASIPTTPTLPQTSTYQVLLSDFSAGRTITVASGTFNLTLVAATTSGRNTQPANGQYITVLNYGSGVVTVVRSGQNINGGTDSLVIPAGSAALPTGARIVSDGSNYFAQLYRGTILAADLPGTLTSGTAITNAALTTPSIGAATGTSLVATGIVSGLAPVTYLQDADPCPTGTHCAVGATHQMGYIINGATTEASATFFDLPAAVAGQQYCFENGAGNSGATTGVMKVIAASGDYITLVGVKSGTSGTTATSGGAAGDAACFIAVKGDEWILKVSKGTWTTN